jgi:hypothetical protein
MQIEFKDIQVGTHVIFDGDGLLFKVLSTALGVFDSYYRKLNPRPWHCGFISRWHPTLGWMICESKGGGVQENPLAIYDSRYYKLYKWLDEPPTGDCINAFLSCHLGAKYDVVAYVWVIIATIINKVTGLNIGRW